MKSKLSLLVGFLVFVSAAPLAHATTFSVPYTYQLDYLGTGVLQTYNTSFVFEASLDKQVYTPGERIWTRTNVISTGSPKTGQNWTQNIPPYVFQDRCGDLSQSTSVVYDSGYPPFIAGVKATNVSMIYPLCSQVLTLDHVMGASWEGYYPSLWLYAESYATTNSIKLFAGLGPSSISMTEVGSLPYCVSTTGSCPGSTQGCATTKGQACTSAPNACGESTTGTIACDGSCSAITPANTCPNPGGVTSSVTVTVSKQKPGINLYFTSP